MALRPALSYPSSLLFALLTVAVACNGGDATSASESASATQASGFTTASSTSTSDGSSGGTGTDTTTSGGESISASGTTSGDTTTTSGGETSTTTSTSEVTVTSTTGDRCDPIDDICCLEEGDVPPHALLDTFLAAYPPANMPKSVADVQSFEPVADGHAMAWSDENVGNELVDADNGGVIEANVEAGRTISRMAAEAALPPGSVIVDVRDDPVIIDDLGTPPPCIGVGWAWGSLLFEAEDTSIGELVYLYVGFCSGGGDVEAFFYSDQAVEICAPTPG